MAKFTKGNPGGPGRPKGSISVVDAIKRKLKQELPPELSNEEKRNYLDLVVEKYFNKIIKGRNDKIMRDIIDRIDGKPRQNIGLDGGEEGKPIAILSNVLRNDSNNQNNADEEEDTSGAGGDECEQDSVNNPILDTSGTN